MSSNDKGAPSDTSKAQQKPGGISETKIPQFEETGFSKSKTTGVFRAVNFELFAKPNFFVMVAGIVAFSSCVGYIAWWRATAENRKSSYAAMKDDGSFIRREKSSKWD